MMRNFTSTFVLIGALLFVSVTSSAQEIKYCGQTEQTEKLFNKYPHLRHNAETVEAEMDESARNYRGGGATDEVLYIPVVFHIIHNGGPENISDEQVYSAMEVLNRDFRALNPDLGQVVSAFQDITADIAIEFRLAKRDPQGNCTKGIVRVQSPLTTEGGEDMKALSYWPRNRYMNVWVCADAGGAAGYTFLPSSVNSNFMAPVDGIVLLHDYTGNIGTSNNFRSRTLTHEVGHWLNLRHTWGSGNTPGVSSNCDQDDGVDDTPNTVGWQSCNTSGESCGSLDNVQNYLEYSYCSRMFTLGQKDRMRDAAQSGVAQRNQLITESNHNFTGIFEEDVLCAADFFADELITCVGEEVQFFDESFHVVNGWTWEFGDGQVIAGADPEVYSNPVVVFDQPGIYSVTLTVTNGSEELTVTRENYVRVLPTAAYPSPYAEGFEDGLSEQDWFIENTGSDVTWELTGLSAFEGERSVRLRNLNNTIDGNIDNLISTTVDLSGAISAEINYRWAYANRTNETDDRLRVSISRDCGKTWVLRKMHRGLSDMPTVPPQNASFTPGGQDDWGFNAVEVANEDFLVNNFRVKFEFEGRGGNNFYLDNINIVAFGQEGTSVYDIAANESFRIYPNPADQELMLEYTLAGAEEVRISLHDALGREVRLLSDARQQGGLYRLPIQREALASGIYVVRVQMANRVQALRVVFK